MACQHLQGSSTSTIRLTIFTEPGSLLNSPRGTPGVHKQARSGISGSGLSSALPGPCFEPEALDHVVEEHLLQVAHALGYAAVAVTVVLDGKPGR